MTLFKLRIFPKKKKKGMNPEYAKIAEILYLGYHVLCQAVKLIYYGLEGRYLSDTDHALDNSSILDKISIAYFIDYSSISDQQPFIV